LVRPKEFKMIEESYKLTIFAFVEKFVSRIYGIPQINTHFPRVGIGRHMDSSRK
jgi:hypothetical protein